LKCAACTVHVFVDDEPSAAAGLFSLGVGGSFMNKLYCSRTNPNI